MDVSLSELRELVMDREALRAAIHGIAKSRTRLSNWTELNWTGVRFWVLFWFFLYKKVNGAKIGIILPQAKENQELLQPSEDTTCEVFFS